MNERLKVFGIVAILGFMAGVIADAAATYVVPALVALLPHIFQTRAIVSGFVGAILTVFMVSIWAYISPPSSER